MQKKKTPERELTIVIPVYNEAASLPLELRRVICNNNFSHR